MLAQSRSDTLVLDACRLDSVEGLIEALNGLSASVDHVFLPDSKEGFDLNRYQEHISGYVGNEPIDLKEIPPLNVNLRLDLIWRFIAVMFLAHTGRIDIYQQNNEIEVVRHNAH